MKSNTKLEILFAATLLAMVESEPISTMAQTAGDNLLTTNSPFVLYLQNPPWIKEMRYVESRISRIGEQGKVVATFWAYHTNLAGIQPSGFFNEELPSPNKYTLDDKLIRGVSDRYYWSTQTNAKTGSSLLLSPTRPEEGGTESNSAQRVGKEFEEKLERFRHFGLPTLLTNSFKLVGHDRFEAQTKDGYALDGKILSATENRPLIITYSLGGATDDVFTVKYAYKPREDLPNYFECREFRHGKAYGNPHLDWLRPVTNWIEKVNYGISEHITNGYSPNMFYTNLDTFSITIWSNGMRYAIGASGRRMAVPNYIPEFPGSESGHNFAFPIVFLISLLAGGFFVWWFRSTSKD